MFPGMGTQKQEPEPEPVPAKTTGDEVREYRVEMFRDLRFSQKEAEILADSKDSKGFPIHWRKVANALEAGCGHRRATWIFSSEPEKAE